MKAYAAMGLLLAGIAVALRAAGGFTPMTSSSSTSAMPRPLPAMAAVTGAVIAVGAAYVLPGPRRSRRPAPPRDSRCTGSPDVVCRGTLIAVFPPCTSTI